ncbi:MAG: CoA transferase [Anaerolineae bacterium]|nr:CoA transferase [Anaerolineae bacterium]NIN94992.1 CoA transferase [Anaerolineae bacterium]NIQ78033.1 CoA transferase [Anaerolineae bacterium]
MTEPTSVLEGILVVDLSQALAGPYCTMLLGDLGADVIKVERPKVGDMSRGWGPPFLDGESSYFLCTNRNKRGITLNLTTEKGQEVVQRLLERSDVLVISLHKMESLQRFSLDYETLRRSNPRLIYCSITGYGHTGPMAGRGGYDVVTQGEAGLMSLTGEPEGGPMRYPVPLADLTTGVYSALGILAALLVRERTGNGQALDMSLLDSQASWLSNVAGAYFATGKRPQRLGNVHPNIVPYQPLRARDKHIIVAVGSELLWERFCSLLGLEETIMKDPRFATNKERINHREDLIRLLEEIIRSQEADHWLERFTEADIPCGPINFVDETLTDPQLVARGMIVELEHPLVGVVRSLGNPVHLSQTPVRYRRPPPLLGEHNQEVLSSLGYCEEEIGALEAEGVI